MMLSLTCIDDVHFVGSVCFATEYRICPIIPENVSLNFVNCNAIWKKISNSSIQHRRHYHHHHQVPSYSKRRPICHDPPLLPILSRSLQGHKARVTPDFANVRPIGNVCYDLQ